jgi:hypothetical protein
MRGRCLRLVEDEIRLIISAQLLLVKALNSTSVDAPLREQLPIVHTSWVYPSELTWEAPGGMNDMPSNTRPEVMEIGEGGFSIVWIAAVGVIQWSQGNSTGCCAFRPHTA